MPYEVSWYLENRIIYGRLTGVVTLDEVQASTQKIAAHIQEGIPSVHLIVDTSDVKQVPNNILAISRAAKLLDSKDMGWSVIVTSDKNKLLNAIIDVLASVSNQLINLKSIHRNSVEEAITFLAEKDPSLAPLLQKPYVNVD